MEKRNGDNRCTAYFGNQPAALEKTSVGDISACNSAIHRSDIVTIHYTGFDHRIYYGRFGFHSMFDNN